MELRKIVNENNTLYLSNSGCYYDNDNYKLVGIELNDSVFIIDNISMFQKTAHSKDKDVVDLRRLLPNLIYNKLNEQLRLYIANNIEDYNIYKRNDIVKLVDRKDKYFRQGSQDYIGILDKINGNIIEFRSYDMQFLYNIEKRILDVKKDGKKTMLLNCYYNQDELDTLVFQEQYKRGIAPKIAYELGRIYDFIKNKHTIKIITSNEEKMVFKNRGVIDSLYDFIKIGYYNDQNLYIRPTNDSYYKGSILLSDIKALQYGKTLFYINHNNLKYEIEYKIVKKIA